MFCEKSEKNPNKKELEKDIRKAYKACKSDRGNKKALVEAGKVKESVNDDDMSLSVPAVSLERGREEKRTGCWSAHLSS